MYPFSRNSNLFALIYQVYLEGGVTTQKMKFSISVMENDCSENLGKRPRNYL